MGGLARSMPFTHIVSLIGVLAISGIPDLRGFLLQGRHSGLRPSRRTSALYLIGLFVAFLTAFYMGRWYFLVWRGEYRGTTGSTRTTATRC